MIYFRATPLCWLFFILLIAPFVCCRRPRITRRPPRPSNPRLLPKLKSGANFGGRIISTTTTTTTQLPIIRPVKCNDETTISLEQCSKNCSGYGGQCVVAKEFQRRCYHHYYGCTETYYNYTCQCKPGFTGAGCEICPPGFYGLNCTFQCPTGLWDIGCTNGCNCSMPGSVSPQSCYPANGNCICAPGYLRRRPPTAEGGGGKGCACAKEMKTEAIVLSLWEGGEAEDCLYPCPEGKWGKECAQKCDCQNGAKCHHERGECKCTEGWTGPKCEVQCVKGTAKPGCKFSCDCFAAEHGKCEESTGLCACFAGFMGPRCEWPCPNGFWGAGCHRRCPQNCPQCHPESGRCSGEQSQWAKNVAYVLKNASDSGDE